MTNKTLAVKVHTFQQKYKNVFQRVILIIRNPYKNIVSFFNYFYGGKNHVGYAQAAHYKGEFNTIFNGFVFHSVLNFHVYVSFISVFEKSAFGKGE